MISNISPVTVITASGTQLQVADSFTSVPTYDQSVPPVIYTVPQFVFQILDSSGNQLVTGSTNMTIDQWNSWSGSSTDAAYILSCVAANEGLTLTS